MALSAFLLKNSLEGIEVDIRIAKVVNSVLEITKKIACNLERASIPYMIIGGQAVLLYREPRLTRDIDVTLGIGPEELEKLKKVVSEIGLKILPLQPEKFVL